MEFEWDDGKRRTSAGTTSRSPPPPFASAARAFLDRPRRAIADGRFEYGGVREVSAGAIDGTLYVVPPYRDG